MTLVPVPHRQMELLAQSLRQAKLAGVLGDDLYRALHAKFRALDAEGKAWTFSLNTRRWHCLQGARWTPREPRGELRIDAAAFEDLGRVRVRPLSPEWKKANLTAARMELLSRALGRAAAQGRVPKRDLARLHRRFVARDEAGFNWSFGIKSLRWHALIGRRWVPSPPPGLLFLDPGVIAEIDALSRPASAGRDPSARLSPPKKVAPPAPPSPPPPPHKPVPPPVVRQSSPPPQPPPRAVVAPTRPAPAPPAPPRAIVSPSTHCAECGASIQPGKKFCPKCGAPAAAARRADPPPAPRCPNPQCARPIPPGKKFCPTCGTKV